MGFVTGDALMAVIVFNAHDSGRPDLTCVRGLLQLCAANYPSKIIEWI